MPVDARAQCTHNVVIFGCIRCWAYTKGKRFATPYFSKHFSYDNMRAVEWRLTTVRWICTVLWVTCGQMHRTELPVHCK